MLTQELQARLEWVLGQRIVTATRRSGGYSLALRFRLELANGNFAFAKVATTEDTALWLRREAVVYEHLGTQSFLAEFLGWDDDPNQPFLLLEDPSEAHWPPPWTPAAPSSNPHCPGQSVHSDCRRLKSASISLMLRLRNRSAIKNL
jgi:hypothetical protein